MDRRDELLARWASHIDRAARAGKLTKKPCALERVYSIAGPRAGALETTAGFENGMLYQGLRKDDYAILRRLLPPEWDLAGDPQVFMSGRFIRIEAAWPDSLAETMIPLKALGKHPVGGGRWIVGKNEYGQTIRPSLCNMTSNFLVSGATGSGKSVTVRGAALQWSADPSNMIILIDGKTGESLKICEQLPGVVGPCAIEVSQIQAALGWAATQMRHRYEAGYNSDERIIIIFDEFQELADDEIIADLMRKIAAQGRAAQVHLIAATQHPTVDTFGCRSTKHSFRGKLALCVDDFDASKVAVGGARPRADFLSGYGDCYLVTPRGKNSKLYHRLQVAYVDETDIEAGGNGHNDWRFTKWPEYDPESIGQELPTDKWAWRGEEIGVGLLSVALNEGRGALEKRAKKEGLVIGSTRGRRLLPVCQDATDWLNERSYVLCKKSESVEDPTNVRIAPDVW